MLMVLFPLLSIAQNATIDIDAIVVSEDGKTLSGAVVSNPANSSATVTDADGVFGLKALENSSLLVSADGFADLEITATSGLTEVVLEALVDEVQLLFRKAERQDVLGGVSDLNVRELLEKNNFLGALEGLNIHTGGFNGSSIWSLSPFLVLIDGMPRNISDILATEVESVTVLKSAAAVAIYGSHAANGVIYITSKRGVVAEQKIDVRINSGMHVRKSLPNYLGTADYMRYYNEAAGGGVYSQEEIERTASGTNPVRYPDVDMFSSDFISKAYNRSDATAEIYGGNENARYYTNIGYAREGSFLNFGEKAFSQRFNLRGNVDMDLYDWLSAHVDAGAIFSSSHGGHGNYWAETSTFRGHRFNPLLPVDLIDMNNEDNRNLVEASQHLIDGKYILGGTGQIQNNIFADKYAGGYNTAIDRKLLFNTGIDMDLGAIAKGLAFRTKMGLDYNTTYNQGYRHQYRVFEPTWAETEDGIEYIAELNPHGDDEKSNVQNVSGSWYQQTMFFSGQLDYKRTINNRHNLLTMLVANNSQQSISGEYYQLINTHLGYYLGYNFLNRYYLDFNGGVMHSTKLPESNRTAFSPVVTIGWRLSDEQFMDGFSALDVFKISATAGKIHSDIGIEEHYMYASEYTYDGGRVPWFAWASGINAPITTSLRGRNEDLRAPYREELSFGLDASFFNRKLQFEGNYFSITTGDGLVQATELFPSYLAGGFPNSSFIPYVNYNEETRTGFDFNLRYKQTTGEIDWIFGVAGTYYDSEITKRSERYEWDYQYRTGKPINSIWGLESLGFFADENDIASSPKQVWGTIRPGDIKYKDQNGDGDIDQQDEVFLGRAGTYDVPFVMGLNLTAKWRNLTFYAQGIGYWGGYGIKNRTTDWVYGERKYSDIVLNRWAYYTDPVTGEVVDTRATATYPRLTTGSGENNFRNSDFWIYSTDRFNLSKVQITYSIPERMLSNSFLQKVDVYVGGSNLLMISSEREYLETNVGQAPQTRFYNLGVSASF